MGEKINYRCERHGEIGGDVLDTHKLFRGASVYKRSDSMDLTGAALPKRQHVCARCAAEVFDNQFAPLRERSRHD